MAINISIIMPTNRTEGFGIIFSALNKQTIDKDKFEIIIVDDYLNYSLDENKSIGKRKTECYEFAKKYNIKNVLYLRGKKNYWRNNKLIANARNTGLIYAKGELIIFTDDYIWFNPMFLEEHWNTYKNSNHEYTLIGGSHAVRYEKDKVENFDELGSPLLSDVLTKEGKNKIEGAFIRNLETFNVSDTRGGITKINCGGGWFYTCNASAPLKKIIEVNGFDEEFDLTLEEDIDLGLRLEKVGCRFIYKPSINCTVFHMDHRIEGETIPKKYKNITYEELRNRNNNNITNTDTNIDEIQLVMKEKYNTKYDGSWGLFEKRNRENSVYANVVGNNRIFDLKAERIKIGNFV